MLPRKHKVARNGFKAMASRSAVLHSPFFTMRVSRKEHCPSGKQTRREEASTFAFVVSGKISRKATERHKLRRRGYAAVRVVLERTKQCFSCIFYFKKAAVGVPYKEIERDVAGLLQSAGVL